MLSLGILTMIFMIAIVLLSLISKEIKRKVLFPVAFSLISIVLFFVSFILGRWEGIGLGAVSASLFVASIIALIAIILLYKTSPQKYKNRA